MTLPEFAERDRPHFGTGGFCKVCNFGSTIEPHTGLCVTCWRLWFWLACSKGEWAHWPPAQMLPADSAP